MEGACVWHDGIPYSDLSAEVVDVLGRCQCGAAAPVAPSPAGAHVAAEEAQGASAEGVVNVRLDLVFQGGWGVGAGLVCLPLAACAVLSDGASLCPFELFFITEAVPSVEVVGVFIPGGGQVVAGDQLWRR